MTSSHGLHRRTLLVGGAALAATGLAGCQSGGATGTATAVDPLQPVLTTADELIAAYDRTIAAYGSLAGRLRPLRADHVRHAAALRAGLTGSSASASVGPSASSTRDAVPVPRTSAAALAVLTDAERRGQRSAASACLTAPAGDTLLIGSISACRASHVAVLGDDPAPPLTATTAAPRPADIARLQAALAGEHAAVYGYGVLGPRLSGATQTSAHAGEQAHRDRRDLLTSILASRHATPTPAAAGYALPLRVTDRATALRLAVLLEGRTGAVWGAGIADLRGALRALALNAISDCAVRLAGWRTAAGISPVTAAFPGRP